MRLRPSLTLVAWCLALLPALALAQDGTVFVSQYFECIVGEEGEADRIAEEVLAPIFDRHMEMGHISTWGWLSHDVGGTWRRASYFASPDMATLFATRDAIVQDVLGDHAEDAATLNTVCPRHEDYIWGSALGDVVPASDANTTERAPAAISQYIRCDFNREAEADAILQRSLAPIYDRWVESGAIQSWNYFAHQVGGEFRRLWTLSGSDYPSLMQAWGEMNDAVLAEEPGASFLYNEICPTHVDYLWNTVLSQP